MTTGVLAESDKNRLKQKENLVDARGSLGVARPHFYTVPVVTEANRDSAWDRGLRGGPAAGEAILEGGHHTLPPRDHTSQHHLHLGSHAMSFLRRTLPGNDAGPLRTGAFGKPA